MPLVPFLNLGNKILMHVAYYNHIPSLETLRAVGSFFLNLNYKMRMRVAKFNLKRQFLFNSHRQRPYHAEYTGSRPITEVKQRRAQSVLGRETTWEHCVPLVSFFKFK